jgi:hypothetical protein
VSTNEHIRCKECRVTFEFLAADLRRFEAKGWQPPKRCRLCAKEKRQRVDLRLRVRDETTYIRACATCGRPFHWRPGEEAYFAAHGWPKPARCPSCRNARVHGLVLSCQDCGGSFHFAPVEARQHEAAGWGLPKRCRECRTLRRERNEETHARRMGVGN